MMPWLLPDRNFRSKKVLKNGHTRLSSRITPETDSVSHFSPQAITFFSDIVLPFYREEKAAQHMWKSAWRSFTWQQNSRYTEKNDRFLLKNDSFFVHILQIKLHQCMRSDIWIHCFVQFFMLYLPVHCVKNFVDVPSSYGVSTFQM